MEAQHETNTKTAPRKRIWVGLLILAGLAPIGTWLWLSHAHAGGKKKQAAPEPKVRVRVVRPEQGGVRRTLTRPASVHSFLHVNLFAKVAGYLQNQKVDIGSRVKKGEILAELFVPEVEADVQKATADLSKARSFVGVAEAQLQQARADLHEARARLEEARAAVTSAKSLRLLRDKQYHRIKSLAESRSIQQEIADEYLQSFQAAEASLQAKVKAVASAEAGVTAAEAKVARRKAEREDAQAQVKVARAALDRATAVEAYTRLRAPFDGVITRRTYDNGDFVRDAATGGNTPPVLAVARTDLMRVIVWVPDDSVPFVRPGRPVSLSFPSLPNRTFKGKVARCARSEDYKTRSMRTEADISNSEELLIDGMYGSITLDLGKTRHGLTIPTTCLVGEGKNDKRTLHVIQNGQAVRRTVRVGLDDGIRAEILSGLKPDDLVIDQHGPGLGDGVLVEVVK